jgi:hypothetical protein
VVTWSATDVHGNTATCQQTVTVRATSPANRPPTAVDDTLTIAEDSGLHTVNVLGNDSDPDLDALTIVSTSQGSHGTVQVTGGGGSVAYRPNANFNGGDAFTYTISDGHGGTAVASVFVTVTPVNHAPVAVDDTYEVAEDDVLTVSTPGVLGNDSNGGSGSLTAVLLSGPAHGSVDLNGNGSFTYTPEDNYSGPDSFTYKANNGTSDSNVATVHIDVLEISGAGDIDLYVKTAKSKVNWSQPMRGSLSISGQINPRGMKDNLTDATVSLRINGIEVLAPQTLDARGRAISRTGSGKTNCRLKNANGAYKIKVNGADLRAAIGVANITETGSTAMTVRLTINGADLEVPVTTARLECPYRTKADKTTSLRFSFRRNRTLSGAFNCNKTTVSNSSKGETGRIRGVVTSEGGAPVVPTGDITVHFGNGVMTLPFASLNSTGAGSNSVWTYTGRKGVSGVTKFLLSNKTHSFSLSVSSNDIGMSAVEPVNALKHDLPLLIEVPTADGPTFFESIIELKRTSATSTRWKR